MTPFVFRISRRESPTDVSLAPRGASATGTARRPFGSARVSLQPRAPPPTSCSPSELRCRSCSSPKLGARDRAASYCGLKTLHAMPARCTVQHADSHVPAPLGFPPPALLLFAVTSAVYFSPPLCTPVLPILWLAIAPGTPEARSSCHDPHECSALLVLALALSAPPPAPVSSIRHALQHLIVASVIAV